MLRRTRRLLGWLFGRRSARPDMGMTYEDLESHKERKEEQLSGAFPRPGQDPRVQHT